MAAVEAGGPRVSFENETVVVTGGTRGLGRAIAREFLAHGATVYATWHANEAAAAAMKDESAGHGERLRLARFDVADFAAVERFWQAIDAEAPDGVQVLVNNSGVRRDRVLALMTPEEWRAVIDTNLTGSFYMSRFAVQHMVRRRYGRIVFITSPAADHGFEGQANYSASKAGQIGMMRSLAREVAKRGITVNCVSPGFVDTELLADLPEKVRAGHLASVPLARFAKPEEVAYAVRCLAAREASYITGATLEVAGGL
jgi:3-oxoacyl-[acyl-carrier protein] reductase